MTKQRMRLGDDGTMDTVIVCADCGEEMRYNYDPSSGDQDEDETDEEAYADFIDWALDDAENEHECSIDHYDGESGVLIVSFPVECGEDCSTPGQPADSSVVYWLKDARVIWHVDDAALRRVLKGYGAWVDLDTADTDTLRGRVLWIGAGDWRNERSNR